MEPTQIPPEEHSSQLSKKEIRQLRRDERQKDNQQSACTRSFKRVGIWIGAVIVLVGIVVGIAKFAPTVPVENQSGTLSPAVSDADWSKGVKGAKVTLVEYGDFQCPACASYHSVVKQLSKDFEGNAQIVFRHFPLSRIHPNADMAAYAAEAAGNQGKFWEMHDMLFENQNTWAPKPNPQGTFLEYADKLSLDKNKFKEDMESNEVEEKVKQQYLSGEDSGVNATPTFFLNGEKIKESPLSYDEFKQLLTQAIENAK